MAEMNFIEKYIPLVKSIAKKYSKLGVEFDDLVQEGLIGLLEANDRFDPAKGNKFSTYAFYWIKKKILQVINTNKKEHLLIYSQISEDVEVLDDKQDYPKQVSSIRIPEDFPEVEKKVLKLSFEESKTLGEISQIMNTTREKIRQIRQKAIRRLRINYELKKSFVDEY